MGLITGDHFEYESNNPDVQVFWAVRKIVTDSHGADAPSELYLPREGKHPQLEIEHIIAEHLDQTRDALVKYSGDLWKRILELNDGSTITFWIILEVID